MTNAEAFQKFKAALNLYATPELIKFHKEVVDSDLPIEDANFWMCLCNDFEDIKITFFRAVEKFSSSGEKFSRKNWVRDTIIEFPENSYISMLNIKGTVKNKE